VFYFTFFKTVQNYNIRTVIVSLAECGVQRRR